MCTNNSSTEREHVNSEEVNRTSSNNETDTVKDNKTGDNLLDSNTVTAPQGASGAAGANKALQIASIYVGDLDPTITEPQLV